MNRDETYLWLSGWLQNERGWWHPPHCLAAWPVDEAVEAARRDEQRGRRMSFDELRAYHAELGLGGADDDYQKILEAYRCQTTATKPRE